MPLLTAPSISSLHAVMAPLQKASRGRTENGSSVWMPTSSMPKRKKAMMTSAGMTAQWFHDLPG